MRNVFDQFVQPENRVTHALMTALDLDRYLLSSFLRELVKARPPRGVNHLRLLEQRFPGQAEQREENQERRGVPDGWIFDEQKQWCVFIETKVLIKLTADQVVRHRNTASRRGYEHAKPVVILPRKSISLPSDVRVIEWRELYAWLLTKKGRSRWATHLTSYLEVIERKLIQTKQFREETLTMFAGFPFGNDEPYTYAEGKRLLKLALDDLRTRKSLHKELGVVPAHKGRGAITGKQGDAVWDFLSISTSSDKKLFTRDPHLTLTIRARGIEATVTLPHGLRTELRRRITSGGADGFQEMLQSVLRNLRPLLKKHPHAVPFFRGIQRRYPTQRSQPFVDAEIDFDLRTAIQWEGKPKLQPVWCEAAFNALRKKRGSNYQVQVGVRYPYDRNPAMANSKALNLIEDAWIACKPFALVSNPNDASNAKRLKQPR